MVGRGRRGLLKLDGVWWSWHEDEVVAVNGGAAEILSLRIAIHVLVLPVPCTVLVGYSSTNYFYK